MARQGNLYLNSESLLGIYEAVKDYGATVQQALYDQYKAAYKISVTNYMRGDAADAFKTYFSQGTINMIQGLLDVSSEMTMIIQLIVEAFYQYESSSTGAISEATLDDIQGALKTQKNKFADIKSELNSVMRKASSYISTVPLECDAVNDEYSMVSNKMNQIREDLYSVDDDSSAAASELLERINSLKDQISQTMGLCYKDGNFLPDNAERLTTQTWYQQQSNVTLALLLAEDPFEYEAGAVTVQQDQWAMGLCSDIYAYAGYSWLSSSYEAGKENGSAFLNACASVFAVSGYAQFTNYIKAEAEGELLFAETDVKVGAGDGYIGAHAAGEVGVAKVDASVIAGTDNFNGYMNASAEVCCADGKAAFEFDTNDGTYAVGVKASATAVGVEAGGGLSFFSCTVDDGTATGTNNVDLFQVNASAKASMGASFGLYIESVTGIETDWININATTVEVDAQILAGGSFSITVPTIYVKWPW